MAPLGGVWGNWWTVWGLSHAIQEVGKRLPILCLSLKATGTDGTGELPLGGRGIAGLFALGADLSDVGVVCHVDIIGTASGDLWVRVDSLPTDPERPRRLLY
jgi:hypothetical protein